MISQDLMTHELLKRQERRKGGYAQCRRNHPDLRSYDMRLLMWHVLPL